MVKYALACDTCETHFEGWFSSSDAFDAQKEAGELTCPQCGASSVSKRIMAPAVSGTKKQEISKENRARVAQMAKAVREHVSSTHEYVGENFADTARAMYYGETESRPVWGQTSLEEAKTLVDEGVPALPLPGPFAPEKPVDQKKLN
ncbi:DUF1178 family protein [Ponticaulis profundi]|uniref:DUF1178 family protein n=1 Tax=Ponticaulis profundi TaxID=2665222 RepID=A0ABW1SB96_9PROT